MTIARAFWITAPGQGELRDERLPTASRDAHQLQTLATGVSRGTEALVFAGRVPPSQYAAMRAPLMGGAFPFPVKYGYSAVGITDDGRRVFVLHPHQDRLVAPAAMCIPIPDTVPTPRAVLAANMETALNLLWDAAPLPAERMMVVGAGVIGLLTAALLARIPAATVTVIDLNPARAALAQAFGCAFATPEAAPAEQELIVHTSATEAGLRLCLAQAAFEARIVEASWYGDAAPSVPLGEAFHARRLRLIASQVGHVAPPMRNRRTHAERLATALTLLDDERFDALLEGPTTFTDLPTAMPEILRPGGLCHVISYECPVHLSLRERSERASAPGEGPPPWTNHQPASYNPPIQRGIPQMQPHTLTHQRHIIDTNTTPLRPDDRFGTPTQGVSWLPLDFDETRREGLYLVRFAPGASSLPHEHVFGEAFIVLQGTLIDSDGQHLPAGTFVRYDPGSRHFSTSPEGCLLGVFLRGPNRRLAAAEL